MFWSRSHLHTLREVPGDAEVVSHQLMLRAGMIRKAAAGMYSFLPAGLRPLRKVEQIVREELNREGALEVEVPILQPRELWEESGRWERFAGDEILFHLKDRKNAEFALAPTAEEAVTDIVRSTVTSYRQLPLNLYQIRTKFRDEIRPRFGLMRGREFLMKDGYSFDVDEAGLDASYKAMERAYRAVFERCGLAFILVDADTGAIGGSASEEFMVLADSGEDAVVKCSACSYGANVEKARTGTLSPPAAEPARERRRVATPNVTSIDEVAKFLSLPAERFIKTLIFETESKFVVLLVRGDVEANEVKLGNALACRHLALAADAKVQQVTGGAVGFSGPVGLAGVEIWADETVRGMSNAVTGANEKDAHLVDVQEGRDFTVARWGDFKKARVGDPCPRCSARLEIHRGIEVGHIFKLGTKYSEKLGCTFLDENQVRRTTIMGTYGIGVSRTVAAAIEQNHDENGIIWPIPLAPWTALVTPVGPSEAVKAEALAIHDQLAALGIDVLLDDRDERPGVKFKDADLVGIPLRITVGQKSLDQGKVEYSERRRPAEKELLPRAEAVDRIEAAWRAATRR